MPKDIKRFVAPKAYIYNFSFESAVDYIATQYAFGCEFESVPEKVVNFGCDSMGCSYADKYITHVDVHWDETADILMCTDEQYEEEYPNLKEINVYMCPHGVQKRSSRRVKISYIPACRGHYTNKCDYYGSNVGRASISSLQDLSEFAGVSCVIVGDHIIPSDIPSSVKELILYSGEYDIDIVKNLPETVTSLTIRDANVTSELLFIDQCKGRIYCYLVGIL